MPKIISITEPISSGPEIDPLFVQSRLRDLESELFARCRTGAKPVTFLANLDESGVYRSTDYAEGF